YDLHRLKLFKPGLFNKTVIIHITVIGKVTCIGYVAHITHLISEVGKRSVYKIEGHKGTDVTQMNITVNGRSANIHTDIALMNWFKNFLCSGNRVIDFKFSHLNLCLNFSKCN